MYNKEEHELEKRTFSVENIIADESQLFIFYRIDTKGDHRYVAIDYFGFFDDNGQSLPDILPWRL